MATAAGNGGTGAGASGATRNRVHGPPVELPSNNASSFLEEAKGGEKEEAEVRRKFNKFCTRGEHEDYLTLEDFCRMLQYYETVSAQFFEPYFHAIDRDRDDRLTFGEFFQGVCAADPNTVHILNSFTGHERSRYIFDFYDKNRNNLLDFEEFMRLNSECSQTKPDGDDAAKEAHGKARELGLLLEDGSFKGINHDEFYQFIQNEKLRGTSRLFRFPKTLLRSKSQHHSRRANTSSSTTGDDAAAGDDGLSDREDLEWHAYLLDMEAEVDSEATASYYRGTSAAVGPVPPPYPVLLPPAPPTSLRPEQPEVGPAALSEARGVALRVLRSLSSPTYDGLLPSNATCSPDDVAGLAFVAATPAQLRNLCNAVARLLESEEMVITGVQTPVKVFGALHGQLFDLLSHFKWQQAPVVKDGDILYNSYVFLGDYSDRGSYSLEVLLLLFSLKVTHPQQIVLLRGHHENRHVNYHMGLRQECERRLGGAEGLRVYDHLNRVFENMSLAVVIGQQLLAIGPGVLPPSLTRLEQLRRYKKPLALPHAAQPRPAQPIDRLNEQVLLELFTPWPLMPRELGSIQELTTEQVNGFCAQHKLAGIILGHRVPSKGYALEEGGRLITVTSCVNYCDSSTPNDGAILCINKERGGLLVQPVAITARFAHLYSVLGRHAAGGMNLSGQPLPRWPVQPRAATPGRVGGSLGKLVADFESDPSGSTPACALFVQGDQGIAAAPNILMAPFPAFGPGRSPATSVSARARSRARQVQAVMVPTGTAMTAEEAALGKHTQQQSRGSLGAPRRSTGMEAAEAETSRRGGVRTPGGSISAAAGGSVTTTASAGSLASGGGPGGGAVAPGATAGGSGGSAAHRRGALSPSSEGSRGVTAGGGGLSPTTAQQGGSTSIGSGGGRDLRGVGGAATRRGSSGGGQPSQQPSQQQPQQRGPSRPPGTGPYPKGVAPAESAAGSRGPPKRRGSAGETPAQPASPRQGSAAPEEGYRSLCDRESLEQLLRGAPRLTAAGLPTAPAQFLQTPRAPESPLVSHICRVWVESGLSDRDWAEALRIFEAELAEQPRQHGKIDPRPTAGAAELDTPAAEGRWTLETFSMWVLKTGRKLKECQTWFEAFDMDKDGMIGVADFLQGLVATAAPRAAEPSGERGLCTALVVHRLLDAQSGTWDGARLQELLAVAQLHPPASDAASLKQLAQRVSTDFDFFRANLLALQMIPLFKIRIFGLAAP